MQTLTTGICAEREQIRKQIFVNRKGVWEYNTGALIDTYTILGVPYYILMA